MTQTMRAIQVHRYGEPEVLQLDEIPRPQPQAGEILVRIHAAGVLPIETVVRSGAFARFMPKTFPYIPGSAFAGVVEEVGAGVTNFVKGQAICGRAPQGSYAEYVTIVADPPPVAPDSAGYNQSAAIIPLAPMPKSWSFDEAATLSGGATTAWTSLFEDGELRYGQRVLIHGAAGGVGLFAVQFARWKGAHVIGTASAANLEFVRSLGAETVIDYNNTPFEELAGEVDLVLHEGNQLAPPDSIRNGSGERYRMFTPWFAKLRERMPPSVPLPAPESIPAPARSLRLKISPGMLR